MPVRDVFHISTHASRLQGKLLPHHSHFGRRNSFHHALILASMALILALPAEARPWKRILLHTVVGASAAVHWEGGRICRRNNGVEPCTEHYGAFTGFEVAQAAFTGSMIALSEKGHKNGFREWFIPEVGVGAFNVWWGIREARTHVAKTDTH